MDFITADLAKLLISLLAGAIIGFEREMHNKSAGFRTITLITVGSTLFTMLSLQLDQEARVAAQIVSGVGFLGAGVILFSEGKVKGLTTAASVWAAAAMGMAIGMGRFALAAYAGLMILVVLWFFVRIDIWLNKLGREIRTYRISAAAIEELVGLDERFKQLHIRVIHKREYKTPDLFTVEWETRGTLAHQKEFTRDAIRNPQIISIDY
ncbi:MAG: MgtC/SapB family protein [Anaerolineales bacterium]|nr:MgtC/SapB family protein [Anaerolineales bacterium]